MTAKELIEELSKLPPDAQVNIFRNFFGDMALVADNHIVVLEMKAP